MEARITERAGQDAGCDALRIPRSGLDHTLITPASCHYFTPQRPVTHPNGNNPRGAFIPLSSAFSPYSNLNVYQILHLKKIPHFPHPLKKNPPSLLTNLKKIIIQGEEGRPTWTDEIHYGSPLRESVRKTHCQSPIIRLLLTESITESL